MPVVLKLTEKQCLFMEDAVADILKGVISHVEDAYKDINSLHGTGASIYEYRDGSLSIPLVSCLRAVRFAEHHLILRPSSHKGTTELDLMRLAQYGLTLRKICGPTQTWHASAKERCFALLMVYNQEKCLEITGYTLVGDTIARPHAKVTH